MSWSQKHWTPVSQVSSSGKERVFSRENQRDLFVFCKSEAERKEGRKEGTEGGERERTQG